MVGVCENDSQVPASSFTMSISIFFATLVASTVVLCDGAATAVLTAPSSVIERTTELETRQQGPTAWICSVLVVESPWTAYGNIRGYLEGGNTQGKDYTNLVLYPVMELFHATQNQSRLCVYLPAEDHCYPPAPSTGAVKAVKQLTKRTYFAIRFWGQASNARVQYYKQKLTKALTTYNKTANLDLFFVSFFSDHVREVRYDPATAVTGPSNDFITKRGLVPVTSEDKTLPGQCPATLKKETLLAGTSPFITMRINIGRLIMFDVQTTINIGSKTYNNCQEVAYTNGYDAFRFENPYCYLYSFGKNFCPCEGESEIFVRRKWLEENEGPWKNPPHPNKALDEIMIYTTVPIYTLNPQWIDQSLATTTANCESALLSSPLGKKTNMSAIFIEGKCFLSNIHDAVNCNQTCKGQFRKALVRKVNPYPIVHFLSNCGQKLQVTAKSEMESSIYLSHPGSGCNYYPGAKSLSEEDCIITFEKVQAAQKLEVVFDYLKLDRNSKGCQDQLMLYTGRATDKASLLKSLCNGEGQQRISVKDAVTINFRRVPKFLGTGKLGFRLSIFNA